MIVVHSVPREEDHDTICRGSLVAHVGASLQHNVIVLILVQMSQTFSVVLLYFPVFPGGVGQQGSGSSGPCLPGMGVMVALGKTASSTTFWDQYACVAV